MVISDEMGVGNISPELRAIEETFDRAYRSNQLLGVHRPTAVWTLLSVFEDCIALPLLGNSANVQTESHRENLFINALKHALRWTNECPTASRFEPGYDGDRYQNARDLIMLGGRYDTVVTIFTYANRGYCNLTLEGDLVVPVPLIDADDARYYAYNRFLAAGTDTSSSPSTDFLGEIAERISVLDRSFRVSINPAIIARAIKAFQPEVDKRFQLPGDWHTTRYSFADLKRVFSVLSAIAAIQFNARIIAAGRGADALGFNSAVLVYSGGELYSRILRYAGLSPEKVTWILEDLTYGSRGVTHPDPALQPIIPVGDKILIAPSLIICSSPERNHCALLNSIPTERDVYATLVDRKEAITRERIVAIARDRGYRAYNGKAAGHDLDLAIIDDESRAVLILELKWFIGPDEVGEVLSRNEELRTGVSQVKTRLSAFRNASLEMQKVLAVTPLYESYGAVVSQNWIGSHSVQDPAVPIISLGHFESALVKLHSLTAVSDWLLSRKYLPAENVHFRLKEGEVRVGEYGAVWWDIESLISSPYDAGLDSEKA